MYIVKFKNREETQKCEYPEDAAAIIMDAVESSDLDTQLAMLRPIADEIIADEDDPDRGVMLMRMPNEAVISYMLECKAIQLEGDGVLVSTEHYLVYWMD